MAYKKKPDEPLINKGPGVSLDTAEKLMDALEKEMTRSDMLFSFLVFALAKLNEPLGIPLNLKELRDRDVPFFITIDKEKRIAACRIVVDDETRKEMLGFSGKVTQEDINEMFEPDVKH
jgi:hypothetical protein